MALNVHRASTVFSVREEAVAIRPGPCSTPFLGPVRVAVLLAILKTPRRFRTKRKAVAVGDSESPRGGDGGGARGAETGLEECPNQPTATEEL